MSYLIPYHTFNKSCDQLNISWLKNASTAFTDGTNLCTIYCPCTMTNYKAYTDQCIYFSYLEIIQINKLYPFRNSPKNLIKTQQCTTPVFDK
jgi:hypothetical protein